MTDPNSLLYRFSEEAEMLQSLKEDRDKLLLFIGEIMQGWPDFYAIDCFELQEAGVNSGLLRIELMEDYCEKGDACQCQALVSPDDFPFECYRITNLLREAIDKFREFRESNLSKGE